MSARVIIADQNPDILRALKALLRTNLNYEVVGEVTSAAQLPLLYTATQPDLVLLDWQLCKQASMNLIEYFGKQERQPKVIVMSNDGDHGRQALAAGAHAYVSKGDSVDWLLEALRLIAM